MILGTTPLVRAKRLVRPRSCGSRRMGEWEAAGLDHREEEGLGRLGRTAAAAAARKSSHIEDQTLRRPQERHLHQLLAEEAGAGPDLSLACRRRSEAT
jgi:hypothetical protein